MSPSIVCPCTIGLQPVHDMTGEMPAHLRRKLLVIVAGELQVVPLGVPGVGRVDAMELLELLFSMPVGREVTIAFLWVWPGFDPLRGDSRYEELLGRFAEQSLRPPRPPHHTRQISTPPMPSDLWTIDEASLAASTRGLDTGKALRR
jgi:hypothetical protein